MLKYWLGLFVLLNAAVLAWQWDAFARWGYGPNQHREPERLLQQVRPEALKFEVMLPASPTIMTPASDTSAEASPLSQASDASAPAVDNVASQATGGAAPASAPSRPQSTPR